MENDVEFPNTKFVRFQNGDDVICELVELSNDDVISYSIINPLKVIYIQSSSGTGLQLAFIPWVFPKICSVQEFIINPEDILLITDTSEKMNKYYWENLSYYINMHSENTELEEQESSEDIEMIDDMDRLTEIIEQLKKSGRTYH